MPTPKLDARVGYQLGRHHVGDERRREPKVRSSARAPTRTVGAVACNVSGVSRAPSLVLTAEHAAPKGVAVAVSTTGAERIDRCRCRAEAGDKGQSPEDGRGGSLHLYFLFKPALLVAPNEQTSERQKSSACPSSFIPRRLRTYALIIRSGVDQVASSHALRKTCSQATAFLRQALTKSFNLLAVVDEERVEREIVYSQIGEVACPGILVDVDGRIPGSGLEVV